MYAKAVFARLQAMFGTRFVQTWRGADMELVYAEWDRALANVARDRVAAAVDDCRQLEQPPDLPKFLALCRQRPSVTDAPRIAFDGGRTTDRETARENLRRIKAALKSIGDGPAARDPLHWAKHPRSVAAVELMIRGAKHHRGLREVLIGHLRDGGDRIPQDAAQMLLEAFDSDHTMLDEARAEA